MRKILIALCICIALLLTGGTALAQGGGAGFFDFVTDVRLHGLVYVLNDLVVVDDVTAEDATVTDDLFVADIIASIYTTVTVTNGSTITPTGSYQRITSAANTGTSAIVGPTAGRFLRLVNVGSNTITLTDTGTLKLTANIALGQFDSLSLMGDGTNWIQLATANN